MALLAAPSCGAAAGVVVAAREMDKDPGGIV
jgi:hypothetical protein